MQNETAKALQKLASQYIASGSAVSIMVVLLRAAISSVDIGSPRLIFRNSSTTNSGGTLSSTSTSAKAFDLSDIIHRSSRPRTKHFKFFVNPLILFRTLQRLERNVFLRFCWYFLLFYARMENNENMTEIFATRKYDVFKCLGCHAMPSIVKNKKKFALIWKIIIPFHTFTFLLFIETLFYYLQIIVIGDATIDYCRVYW